MKDNKKSHQERELNLADVGTALPEHPTDLAVDTFSPIGYDRGNTAVYGLALSVLFGFVAAISSVKEAKVKCAELLASSSASLWTYSYQRQQTKREMDLNIDMHKREQRLNTKMHLVQINADMEQNEDQLENDLNLASKESQRDMYDASNQKLQTLILASTVMFVSLTTIIIQGNYVDTTPVTAIQCISIFGGLSFCFLFGSIVMCIELLNRTARFMMNQSNQYQYLNQAILKVSSEQRTDAYRDNKLTSTKDVGGTDEDMSKKCNLNQDCKSTSNRDDKSTSTKDVLDGADEDTSKSTSNQDDKSTLNRDDKSKYVVRGSDMETSKKWNAHEDELYKKMNERREKRKKVFDMETHLEIEPLDTKVSFGQFWADIQDEAKFADNLFYAGTWCMLLTASVFLFTSRYDDTTSNYSAFILIIVALVFMLVYVVFARSLPAELAKWSSLVTWRLGYLFGTNFLTNNNNKKLFKHLLKQDKNAAEPILIHLGNESASKLKRFETFLHSMQIKGTPGNKFLQDFVMKRYQSVSSKWTTCEAQTDIQLKEEYMQRLQIVTILLDKCSRVFEFFAIEADNPRLVKYKAQLQHIFEIDCQRKDCRVNPKVVREREREKPNTPSKCCILHYLEYLLDLSENTAMFFEAEQEQSCFGSGPLWGTSNVYEFMNTTSFCAFLGNLSHSDYSDYLESISGNNDIVDMKKKIRLVLEELKCLMKESSVKDASCRPDTINSSWFKSVADGKHLRTSINRRYSDITMSNDGSIKSDRIRR